MTAPDYTQEDLQAIGREMHALLEPLRQKHPGLEYAVAFIKPKESDPTQAIMSLVSTVVDPRSIVVLLVGAARHVQERLMINGTTPPTALGDA